MVSTSCCHDPPIAKVHTTLTLDEDVLRAVKLRAASTGRGDSEVIEDALRRDLGLEFLERIWAQATLHLAEAQALAVEAQHRMRQGSWAEACG